METSSPETRSVEEPTEIDGKYERLEKATAQDIVNALKRAIAGEPIPGESVVRREKRKNLELIDDIGVIGINVSETFIRNEIRERAYRRQTGSLRQSI